MNKPPVPPSVNRPNENVQNDPGKTRLMERKQQQWKQENGTFFACYRSLIPSRFHFSG